MEQVLLSSPAGRSDWELEQKQSLGFLLLEPDKGVSLSKGSKESPEPGLDYRAGEEKLVSLNLDEILQENALNLDDLLRSSGYPSVDQILSWEKGRDCTVLQWEKNPRQGTDFNHNRAVELVSFQGSPATDHTGFSGSPALAVRGIRALNSEPDFSPESSPFQPRRLDLVDGGREPPPLSQDDDGSESSSPEDTLLPETEGRSSFHEPEMDLPALSHELPEGLPEGCESPPSQSGCSGSQESAGLSGPDHESCPSPVDHVLRSETVSPSLPAGTPEQDASAETLTASSSREDPGNRVFPQPALPSQSSEPAGRPPSPVSGAVSDSDGPDNDPASDWKSSRDLVPGQLGSGQGSGSCGQEHKDVVSEPCLPAVAMQEKDILEPQLTEGVLCGSPVLAQGGKSTESEADLGAPKDIIDLEQNGLHVPAEESLVSGPLLLRTSSQPAEEFSVLDVELSPSLPAGGSVSYREDSPRAEDVSPLRAVFDALDQDRDGFVRMEEFVQFATVYGAEQVKDLTRFLDPSGLGVISFEDFYRGITAISNGGSEAQLYEVGFNAGDEAGGCPEEYDDYAAFETGMALGIVASPPGMASAEAPAWQQNEVTDSAYLGSESTYSECETFTDEDTGTLVHHEMHEEVETDSAIDSTLHDSEEAGSRSMSSCLLQDLPPPKEVQALSSVLGCRSEQAFKTSTVARSLFALWSRTQRAQRALGITLIFQIWGRGSPLRGLSMRLGVELFPLGRGCGPLSSSAFPAFELSAVVQLGSGLSLGSELNNHSLVTVISGQEEHFEDFGEGHDSELLLDSPDVTEGDTTPDTQVHNSTLLLPDSADPFPASFQSFLREEVLDFFCSQCHKQISRLEDLSTRLNYLEMNRAAVVRAEAGRQGWRRSCHHLRPRSPSPLSSHRHLHQSSILTLDSMEDLSRDILDLADTDITDKVMFLEKRVSELEKDSTANGEQHARLRQENLQLVHRANALEEQLKEQETRAEEAMLLEVRRQKEALSRLERERGMELENLQSRLQQLDEENSELRSCVPCLRANIERLDEEKRKLQDEVEDVTERLNEELEARRKLSDKLAHERHKNQKEKESTQELIEDLRKQLELLQLYKLEAEAKRGRSSSAGLQEYNSRTREAELEQEIRRLKQDNRNLKEQNDELNGQIINLSIQGAKNLFAASFSESLAAEINSVSRDELMEAIHKQEEINYRLQDYIDRIIVAIMESNPSILEVK
nr:PREDICTED: rab11 family-interacting protein 3 [Lepisosteus oculatus]